MRRRRLLFLVVAAVLIVFLLVGMRVRLAKAAYHAERRQHWLNHFVGKMLRIQNTLALRQDVDELTERFSEIRTQIRYLDMILGHHDDRLHVLSRAPRLRKPEDNDIARLWLALGLFRNRLQEDPPPDLSDRTVRAVRQLDPIIRRMNALVSEPGGRALLIVPTLSGAERDEFNALVRESLQILLYTADIEPTDSMKWYSPE